MTRRGERRTPARIGTDAAGVVILVALLVGWWVYSGQSPLGPRTYPQPVPSPALPGPSDTATALRTIPGGVRLTAYEPADGGVRLTYLRGADDCFGTLLTPRVDESDVAVTITLLRRPERRGPCPQRDTGSVFVDLDGPVGDRSLLDGSYFGRRVRVEPAS